VKNILRAVGDVFSGRVTAERDRARADRDRARAAEAAMKAERDLAYEERDKVVEERDAARSLLQNRNAWAAETAPPALSVREGAGFPRGSGKHAFVVPVHGPIAGRELKVTLPFFEEYCRQAGLDLLIVDVPRGAPFSSFHAGLRPIVEVYDRFVIAQPHVLIRDGCPDLLGLVPESEIGAVVEGRWIDRREHCAELTGLCGFSAPLPATRYINTDLLVLSRNHLSSLEGLAQEPIGDYLLGAQDALNVLLYRDDIPVHGVPRDFNWVPSSAAEYDWRWSWIFNVADTWRVQPTQTDAWKPLGDGDTGRYSRTRLKPEHCRLPSLLETAEQLRGNDVRVVGPGEMSYQGLSARIHLTAADVAVMWCAATGTRDTAAIYGPYFDLPAGRWSVTLLAADGCSPADPEIVVDVAHDHGRNLVRQRGPIGPEGSFDIFLDRDVTNVEVRMYSGNRAYSVGAVVFTAAKGAAEAGGRKP
jgi:hypothetical protein